MPADNQSVSAASAQQKPANPIRSAGMLERLLPYFPAYQ